LRGVAGEDARGIAWLAYLPIPGLGLVPALARPDDRLARYHAWQGTVLVVGFLIVMAAGGLLTVAVGGKSAPMAAGLLLGLIFVAGVGQMLWGGIAAAMGRYPRLRPAWDLARLLRRSD
jgi:hypothetical protein